MNTDVFTHRIAHKVLRGSAAGFGLIAGAAIIVLASQALSGRAAQLEGIATWCSASRACVGVPTTWGSSILSVHESKLGEATDLVSKSATATLSDLVRFPRIEVVAAARIAPKVQQRQKNRPTTGGNAK